MSQKATLVAVPIFERCAAIESRDFHRMQQRTTPYRHCWRAELNAFREIEDGYDLPNLSIRSNT